MKKVFLAVACLAMAALSCQAFSNVGGDATPVAVETPVAGDTLLQDDFSTVAWGTGTDEQSSIEYANEALHMVLFAQNHFVWSTPNNQVYENIHVEVTATNNNSDPRTAFGIICNMQPQPDSFYYFAITPAGQYAIVKATVDQQSDVFLTGDNQWAYSEFITPNATSYRLGADCGNGTLTLYVDGQQIDSVLDTSYPGGVTALFVWSGEEVDSADIAFDNFLITRLGP